MTNTRINRTYQIPEHEKLVLATLESTLKQMLEMNIPYKAVLMRIYLAYDLTSGDVRTCADHDAYNYDMAENEKEAYKYMSENDIEF